MTKAATITETAATVAEQGATLAPEKASSKKGTSSKKGAPKGKKADKRKVPRRAEEGGQGHQTYHSLSCASGMVGIAFFATPFAARR